MATFTWPRMQAFLLVVIVLFDHGTVNAAPRPAITPNSVPAKPGLGRADADISHPSVLESETNEEIYLKSQMKHILAVTAGSRDVFGLGSITVDENNSKSIMKHLLKTAAHEDTFSTFLSPQEVDEAELVSKAEYIFNRRAEMVTDDLQEKAQHIMEDASDYNSKLHHLGDVEETIRASCGQDVLSAVHGVLVNLGDEQDVGTVLTTVALLQLHQCPSAALTLTSRLLAAVESQTPEDPMEPGSRGTEGLGLKLPASQSKGTNVNEEQSGLGASSHFSKVDHCSRLPECKRTGIPDVRGGLARHPSLLVVYDVAVAAVFSPEHTEVMAKALADDVTGELNITAPEAELGISDQAGISKRSSCVNKRESKGQDAISWVPFLGTFYNLVSSAIYTRRGCTDVAKQRALEGYVDMVLDAVSVVTVGTGAKALVKAALKQDVEATANKSLRKVTKGISEEPLEGSKNPIQGTIPEVTVTVRDGLPLAEDSLTQVTVAPNLAKDEQTLATDVPILEKHTPTLNTDVPTIATDVPSLTTTSPTLRNDSSTLTTEVNNVVKIVPVVVVAKTVPSVAKTVPSVSKTVPSVSKTVPSVSKTVPSVAKTVPSVAKTVPSVAKTVPSVAKTVPSVAKTVPSVAKTVPSVAKTVAGTASIAGNTAVVISVPSLSGIIPELGGTGGKTTTNSDGDRGVPDTGKPAERKSDEVDNTHHDTPDESDKVRKRCKRSDICDPSEFEETKEKILDDVDNQFRKRGSPQTQDRHAGRWDQLWNKHRIQDESLLPHTAKGELYKNIKGLDLTNSRMTNKKLFQTIQQKAAEYSPLYVKQNLGGSEVKYIAQRQAYRHSSDQVVIKVGVPGPNGRTVFQKPASYADIARHLDNFANKFPDPALKRQEMAEAMRKAVYDPPAPNVDHDFKNAFENDPKAMNAANEFVVITQVAEAVPGRVKGNDAYFRAGLKNIAKGRQTFQQFNNYGGVVTKPGGLKHGKTFFKGTNPNQRMTGLSNTGSNPEIVHETVEGMSDPSSCLRK